MVQQAEESLDIDVQDEIRRLEAQLATAKQKLRTTCPSGISGSTTHTPSVSQNLPTRPGQDGSRPRGGGQERKTKKNKKEKSRGGLYSAEHSFHQHHHLLLLSDSALPLGSFAFSSGLESYREHARAAAADAARLALQNGQKQQQQRAWSFAEFLPLSLSSYASTTLPFVLAAHRRPGRLVELDDALDAATICTVGRRASCAQGRALLGIWEKSLVFDAEGVVDAGGVGGMVESNVVDETDSSDEEDGEVDVDADADVDISKTVKDFSVLLRRSGSSSFAASGVIPPVSAHLAPLFGVISRALGLDAYQTAYVFMLSHVKALVSAAIRAGMFGPFQAQKILAGREVRDVLPALIEREWETKIEDAGQSSPVVDLWIGRHEILYSRVFNS